MSFIKNQRTIAKETSCVGIGLHTGVESKITFKPAPEDFGIRFKRMDVDGCPEIKADIDHVVDISRGTLLKSQLLLLACHLSYFLWHQFILATISYLVLGDI